MNSAPFYADWTFWTMVVALLALLLSQLPPIKQLLKGAKLEVHPYDRINITHTAGNPNASLYLGINNTGGCAIHVRSIHLQFKRADIDSFELQGRQYWPSLTDTKAIILTPFTVKPDEYWGHMVTFFRPFSRNEEKEYRQLVSNIKQDIFPKKVMPEFANVLVEANLANVASFLAFYTSKFKWEPGEYEVTLIISTEPTKASVSNKYRLTMFESDAGELKSYANQYKYGVGVYFFNRDEQPGVHVPITRV